MRIVSKFVLSRERFGVLRPFKSHPSCLPTRFKSSKTHPKKSSAWKNTHKKQSATPSIYIKIKEIVGADNSTIADGSSKLSITNEINLSNQEVKHGCSGAQPNAQQREPMSQNTVPKETHVENRTSEDVSPIIQKITHVVRSESSRVCMEEQLEELSLSFTPEIVEKVLKRCFKVGHLVYWFFNWVKLQPGFHHTTETYNAMIYIAGEAKEFDLVEKLVKEMEKALCPKSIKTWTILISHYGKAKQIGKALWTFEAMRKSGCNPDKGVYQAILFALISARKVELALEFYKEMAFKHISVDVCLYTMLMNCLSRTGDIEAVRLVGDDMVKIAQVPECDVYMHMLKSFCISGKIEEAQELFEEIHKKNINFYAHYGILVKGLCKASRLAEAIEIVDNMKQHSSVDSKIYGCLIDGFLRKGAVAMALDLLHDIRKSGCSPMVSSYTQVIQHLFSSDQYEKACETYEEMVKNGTEPDIVSITAMVAGHVRHSRILKAWEIFESMKKKGIAPTRKAYSVFIKELCKASKTEEALKVLNEMLKSNINATDDIFRLVICSLTRMGELDKASKVEQLSRSYKIHSNEDVQIWQSADCESLCEEQEISHHSLNQDVNSISTQIEYNENLKEVCRILSSSTDWSLMQEALERSGINFIPELVERILRNCQRHGHAALQFFSWTGRRIGYTHTTETYNMAIKIAGSAKDFRHMRELYRDMRRGCCVTPNTWTIMIAQYGQAGLTEMALKTFKEMKSVGYLPDGSTYKYLIVFLCGKKGRKIDAAMKIFQEMIHAGYKPDKEMLEIYLSSLCESGKLEDANRCAKSLCNRGFTNQLTYSLLTKALCRAGRVEEALVLIEGMDCLGCTMDQYIYGSIVHALLRGGRLDEALDKVEAMKRAGISQTVHIHTSLIVHFCKEKQIGKAVEIFKKMREDCCEPTVVTYSALIRGFINMGMVSDAWDIFRRMKIKGPFPDFETYSMFITCLCKAGRSEEGLLLIHEMLESSIIPSAVNFRTVFHGLNREGKQDLAHSVLRTKWFLIRKRKFSI